MTFSHVFKVQLLMVGRVIVVVSAIITKVTSIIIQLYTIPLPLIK